MSHEEGRVAGRFSNSRSISPEDMRDQCWPLGDVAFAGLHQGFADSAMLHFDDTICPRVVSRDPDVLDAVLASQPV